eukprot:scaffold129_cov254-Pinguiococcus_pyrenoidosus.AAC.9
MRKHRGCRARVEAAPRRERIDHRLAFGDVRQQAQLKLSVVGDDQAFPIFCAERRPDPVLVLL